MTDEEEKDSGIEFNIIPEAPEEQRNAMNAVATAYADVAEKLNGQRPVFLVIVSLSTGGVPGDGLSALSTWPVPGADEKMLEKARGAALEVAHNVVCTAGRIERIMNDAIEVSMSELKVCKKEDLN